MSVEEEIGITTGMTIKMVNGSIIGTWIGTATRLTIGTPTGHDTPKSDPNGDRS